MQENNSLKVEKDLQQIAEMLLLNGTLTECPGLVHGKMGIAVFFFYYSQFTGNEIFADYAMDLVSEMLDQLHINSPADYEKGVAGIGVGIDYLIHNNFLIAENDICEDFDKRMIRAVMYDPWSDFSQYRGLTGYGRYWITRLYYPIPAVSARECLLHIVTLIDEKILDISIAEQTDVLCFLHDLQKNAGFDSCCFKLLEKCRRYWNLPSLILGCFPRLGDSDISNIIRDCKSKKCFNNSLFAEIDLSFEHVPDLNMENAPVSTGLLNGYAGEGLFRLTSLNKINISWMDLL